jgi:gas vesicle protein
MQTNKTIIGILGAAAVGAVLGILFAPDKGENTRKRIIKKTSETGGELKEKLDQLKESIAHKYQSAINKGEKIIENGQIDIDNIKEINEEIL